MRKYMYHIVLFSILLFTTSCKGEDRVLTIIGEGVKANYYSSLEEVASNAEIIIYGHVTAMESRVYEYDIFWTRETVEIEECMMGDYQKGDMIYVFKFQGTVPYEEYAAFKGIENKASRYEYVSSLMRGDEMAKVGTTCIYFLTSKERQELKDNLAESFPGTDSMYFRVGEEDGELRELINGEFAELEQIFTSEFRNGVLKKIMNNRALTSDWERECLKGGIMTYGEIKEVAIREKERKDKETESEIELESADETVAERETEVIDEGESETGNETESESTDEVEAERETESISEGESETGNETESESADEAEAEREAESASKSESEKESEQETTTVENELETRRIPGNI